MNTGKKNSCIIYLFPFKFPLPRLSLQICERGIGAYGISKDYGSHVGDVVLIKTMGNIKIEHYERGRDRGRAARKIVGRGEREKKRETANSQKKRESV